MTEHQALSLAQAFADWLEIDWTKSSEILGLDKDLKKRVQNELKYRGLTEANSSHQSIVRRYRQHFGAGTPHWRHAQTCRRPPCEHGQGGKQRRWTGRPEEAKKMGEIQVVFTAGGFLGHLGRVFGLTWTHVAFRFRSSSGERRIIESSAYGVVERDWLSFVNEAFDHRLYETSSPLSEEQSSSLMAYIRQCVGRPYDYWGFVRVIWRELRRRWLMSALLARSYICSGLVYDAFMSIGLDLAPGHPDLLVLPDELAASPLLVKVIE